MTKAQANRCLASGALVQAGTPGTNDHDTGKVVMVSNMSRTAVVAWQSGTRTVANLTDLSLV